MNSFHALKDRIAIVGVGFAIVGLGIIDAGKSVSSAMLGKAPENRDEGNAGALAKAARKARACARSSPRRRSPNTTAVRTTAVRRVRT